MNNENEVSFDRSEDVGELMTALAKAQGAFEAATKDSANSFYDSRYADLATIIKASRKPLSENGIAMFHSVSADLERQTASATAYLFLGNQFISASLEIPAVGKSKDNKDRFDAQTIGAAQTYCRRYTIAPLLGIAQEDDDGNTVARDDAKKFGKKTPDPVQARTEQRNSQPSDNKPHEAEALIEGTRLTVSVVAVEKKRNQKLNKDYLVVWPDGTIQGHDRLTVWDDKLFDCLFGKAHGKVCSFDFASSADGKYWSIKKVWSVGEDVIEDSPKEEETVGSACKDDQESIPF